MKNRHSKYRILSTVLATVLTAGTVFSGGAVYADVNAKSGEYFFSDFEGIDFTPTDPVRIQEMSQKLKEAGYTPTTVYSDRKTEAERMLKTEANGQGLLLGEQSGGTTNSAKGNFFFQDIQDKEKFSFKQMEEEGKAVVFSMDVFVPEGSNIERFGPVICVYKGTTIVRGLSTLPNLSVEGKSAKFSVNSGTSDVVNTWPSTSHHYKAVATYPVDGDTWFNLKTVITYENGIHVSRYYVNGEPVMDKGQVCEFRVANTAVDHPGSGSNGKKQYEDRERFGIWCYYTGENPGAVIDNIYMGLYDSAKLADTQVQLDAEDKTAVLKFENGYTFSKAEGLPTQAKMGGVMANTVSKSTVIVEKFDKDDKLMLSPVRINDFEVSAKGDSITLSNFASDSASDIYRVTLKGLKSIDNKEIPQCQAIVKHTGDILPTDIRIKDMSNQLIVQPLDKNGALTLDANVIEVDVPQGTKVSLEGDSKVWNADSTGVISFDSNILMVSKTYTLKIDGKSYCTFTTAADGGVRCGYEINDNILTLTAANLTTDAHTVFLAVMYYDDKGVIKAVDTKPYKLKATNQSTFELELEKADSYKVVVWNSLKDIKPLTVLGDKLSRTAMYEADGTGIKVSGFNTERKARLQGRFEDIDQNVRMCIALVDEDGKKAVYADDIRSAADGSFDYVITMPESVPSGSYSLVVSAGDRQLSMQVHYAKRTKNGSISFDSATALREIKNAESAEAVLTIVDENRTNLELSSKIFDEVLDASQKSEVAEVFYAKIKALVARYPRFSMTDLTAMFKASVVEVANEYQITSNDIETK